MIQPTIGRMVLVNPRIPGRDEALRWPGRVCFVHDDGRINVAADDENATPVGFHNLTLVQEGEEAPAEGAYAHWMPYQNAVAKGDVAPTLHKTE